MDGFFEVAPLFFLINTHSLPSLAPFFVSLSLSPSPILASTTTLSLLFLIMADSSQIRPHKSLLVIGGKSDIAGSANPKPHGVSGSNLRDSSKPGLKRDSRYYENGDAYNLSIKKSRTALASDPGSNSENSKKIVPLAVKPLTVVEADTPKLSRQFWKAGDDKEDEHVPRYCNILILLLLSGELLRSMQFETLIV